MVLLEAMVVLSGSVAGGYNVEYGGKIPAGDGKVKQLPAIQSNVLGIRGVHGEVKCCGLLHGRLISPACDNGKCHL